MKLKNSEGNPVKTKEGALILDSHKLSYHYERVKAWENGEQIAPVCVDTVSYTHLRAHET